jgi:anti-sigma factor RsiW
MNCAQWEAEIALYAGEDLVADRVARVASHLEACAECQALLEELRASRAALGELRDEPLEDAMVAQVRRRVLAQVNETRRPRPLLWKLALAAAVVLAVWLALPRQARKPVPAVAGVAVPHRVEPAPPPAVRAPVVAVRHRLVRRKRRVEPPRFSRQAPLLVQLVTDDPNIVIYWVVDQKPEGD